MTVGYLSGQPGARPAAGKMAANRKRGARLSPVVIQKAMSSV